MQLHDIKARLLGESQTTGLDVGHHSIKLVSVLHRRSGASRILVADMEPLPEGTLLENEIRDGNALTLALNNLLGRAFPAGMHGDLVVSVNWTSGILCDRISVKIDKNRNEDEVILQSAMSRSPFDDTDNVLDYEILQRREDGSVDALVVAAKNNMLNNWAIFYNNAGLKPTAIDIDAFAVCNTFFASSVGQDPEQSVAIFNMGEKKAHLSYIRGGVFHTARTVQSGSVENAIHLMSRHMNIDANVCRAIIKGEKKDGFEPSALAAAMDYVCEEMSMGVEIALRYFSAADSSGKPIHILLTGGGASLPGLAKSMSERLSLEVGVLSPFECVEFDPAQLAGGSNLEGLQNIYASALGLAMRRF